MFFAVLIVFSLLAGPSFGLVALPISPAQSQAGAQFTAAETLLSQTGTIGQWTFQEPPGYTPVTCHYPTDSTTQLQSILFPIPMILPVPGVLSQPIEGTVEI